MPAPLRSLTRETNASGQATATLTAMGVAAGTMLTVTATAGSATGKTTVTVATTQQTLTLSTSLPQIASNGSTTANLTATLLDANNNAVSGATVNFSANSGVVTGAPATTDANGRAVVQLNAGNGSYQDRTITVSATSGSSTAQIKVAVVGTSLTITGPSNLVLGQSGTFTVALVDSGGAGIAGQTVTLKSANGNTIPTSVTTSSTGQATFTFTGIAGGADTITGTALGQSATASITVSAQSFSHHRSGSQCADSHRHEQHGYREVDRWQRQSRRRSYHFLCHHARHGLCGNRGDGCRRHGIDHRRVEFGRAGDHSGDHGYQRHDHGDRGFHRHDACHHLASGQPRRGGPERSEHDHRRRCAM